MSIKCSTFWYVYFSSHDWALSFACSSSFFFWLAAPAAGSFGKRKIFRPWSRTPLLFPPSSFPSLSLLPFPSFSPLLPLLLFSGYRIWEPSRGLSPPCSSLWMRKRSAKGVRSTSSSSTRGSCDRWATHSRPLMTNYLNRNVQTRTGPGAQVRGWPLAVGPEQRLRHAVRALRSAICHASTSEYLRDGLRPAL